MKAQINIEFLGGAVLFFAVLTFVMTGPFTILPKYENINQLNSLETTGWIISNQLINEQGYWESSNDNGTRWEDHPGKIASLGLSEGYHRIDPKKAEKLLNNLSYTNVKASLLGIEKDFKIKLREFIPVDTHKTFQKGKGSKYGFVEPQDSIYLNSDEQIHYGSHEIQGKTLWVLTAKNMGKHSIYTEINSKNFTDCNKTNSTDYFELKIGGEKYIHDINRTNDVETSDGSLVIFRRNNGTYLGEFGREPPKTSDDYVKIKRFGTIGKKIIEIEITVW